MYSAVANDDTTDTVHLMYIKVLCQCDSLQKIKSSVGGTGWKDVMQLGENAKAPFPPVTWGLTIQCKSLSLSLTFYVSLSALVPVAVAAPQLHY